MVRQPRNAALAALMLLLALLCIAAGTWQISRFEQSVRDNHAMNRNAKADATTLTTTLVPLVGHGRAPGRDAIRYRTVTVTGSYLPSARQFLRNQSLNGTNGYYVLTPLRTPSAILLVVRGFVPATSTGAPPSTITAPPAGSVRLTGRLQTPSSKNDDASRLPDGEVESINPAEQATRLNAPTYQAYLTLGAGQPGTSGLDVLPGPDLSNPAGGVVAPQHFAYIIQWYLFALLALAAPFLMARHDIRDAQRRFLGIDPDDIDLALEAPGDEHGPSELASAAEAGTVALRADGTLARADSSTAERWQRAARLADRYGRSLGPGGPPASLTPSGPRTPAPGHDRPIDVGAGGVHRSQDAYHGSYNDYLWQLAMADGSTPEITPDAAALHTQEGTDRADRPSDALGDDTA